MLRRFIFSIACVGIAVYAAACSKSSDSDSSPDASPPVERIMGGERLGWDQPAASEGELGLLRFVIEIDGVRSDLADTACQSSAGTGVFLCSAVLPSMTPGRHTLRVQSIATDTGTESRLSEPLVVIMAGASVVTMGSDGSGQAGSGVAPGTLADASNRQIIETVDHLRLTVEEINSELVDATDLIALPDGRLMVGERRGTVQVVYPDRPQGSQLVTALTLNDVDTNGGGGLLSIAIAPDFVQSGSLYAVYTSSAGFQLVRVRQSGDKLGDRAVLVDNVLASSLPAADVRFGPDSKLYLALDDGGRAARAGDLGSYNGKVLRLNGDASTPSDQPGGNPVYVGDINQPRGVAWSKSQPVLWIVQTASGGAAELRAVVRDTLGRSGQAGRIVARYVLPQGITPGQMTMYQHERVPALRNNLLIAAGSQGILRVQFDAANPTRVVSSERLQIAPDVRAVAEGGDGSILVATGERLLKIVP